LVAKRLEADYVDRLILTNVARQVGATVEALHEREERPPTRGERFSRLLQRILERSAVSGAGGDPYFGPGVAAFLTEEYEDLPQPTITKGHELEDEAYIEAVHTVLEEMAEGGNTVIVGRGSHVILKDLPNVLRVGVVSEYEDRVATIMERERISRDDAERIMAARDEARAYYFRRFLGLDNPDAPELFHMVVNISELSLDYAAEMVAAASMAHAAGRLGLTAKAVT
jgi:cytidylate kinase